jgi:hypothetical protein
MTRLRFMPAVCSAGRAEASCHGVARQANFLIRRKMEQAAASASRGAWHAARIRSISRHIGCNSAIVTTRNPTPSGRATNGRRGPSSPRKQPLQELRESFRLAGTTPVTGREDHRGTPPYSNPGSATDRVGADGERRRTARPVCCQRPLADQAMLEHGRGIRDLWCMWDSAVPWSLAKTNYVHSHHRCHAHPHSAPNRRHAFVPADGSPVSGLPAG